MAFGQGAGDGGPQGERGGERPLVKCGGLQVAGTVCSWKGGSAFDMARHLGAGQTGSSDMSHKQEKQPADLTCCPETFGSDTSSPVAAHPQLPDGISALSAWLTFVKVT